MTFIQLMGSMKTEEIMEGKGKQGKRGEVT